MGEQALFGTPARGREVLALVALAPEAVLARAAVSGPGPAVGLLEALPADRWHPWDLAAVVRPWEVPAPASEAPRRGSGRPPRHC